MSRQLADAVFEDRTAGSGTTNPQTPAVSATGLGGPLCDAAVNHPGSDPLLVDRRRPIPHPLAGGTAVVPVAGVPRSLGCDPLVRPPQLSSGAIHGVVAIRQFPHRSG